MNSWRLTTCLALLVMVLSQTAWAEDLSQVSVLPSTDQAHLLQWVDHVSPSLFTYNSQRYPEQLKHLSGLFSQRGWQRFADGLKQSQNLDHLREHHLEAYASTTAPAKLIGHEMSEQGERWFVSVPMNVFYENKRIRAQQSIKMVLVVGLRASAIEQIAPSPFLIQFATTKVVSPLKTERLHWCQA